jgi:hypothetical protein
LDERLTVTRRLNRSLNVTDALDGHTVLVVSVDELVLELTDLVDENTELVGDIRDIVVAALTPDGKLLLCDRVISANSGEAVIQSKYSQQPPYAHGQRAPLIA